MNTNRSANELSAIKPNFLQKIQMRITNSKSSYLACCFAVPVILTFLLYLAMEIHPFGNGSVLVLDLNAQYVYFFEALQDFVRGDADMLYSFSRALGGEFVGMYAYYLASPLSFIVALFPEGRMLEALLVLFLLKAGLCGLSFGYYLHKNSKNTNKIMVVAFSTMYALCAFAVIHQNNTMWTDALIWLPLLTLGIEQLVKFGKFKLFVISLALTVWSNYYIGYMVCIYVAAYFVYYFMAYGDVNNPRSRRAHFLRSTLRIAFFSLIALAMSAFIIFGAYYSLGFGKSEFSSPDWAFKVKFSLLDFFTKFLPGAYDTVRPEGLPFVYTGMLTLLLVPVYFMTKKISTREKAASIAFIGFFCLCFMASPLDLVWHGFQAPNWLNYRYSFMLCFFLLVLAYKGFGNLRRANERFLLGITAFIVLFVAIVEKREFETYLTSEKKLLTLQCIWLSVIAAVVLFVVLCLLIKSKKFKKRESITGILAAVICIEVYCSGLAGIVEFNEDVVYSNYSGYNSFISESAEITDLVLEEDPSFYRMEKNFHRTVNDNMALGIRGLSNSTSTLNRETIDFLRYMGYSSHSHWSQYAGGTPVNDSILGIKYVLDEHSSSSGVTVDLYYDEVYTTQGYSAYLNPYALSLAYGVDKSINDVVLQKKASYFERMNHLVSEMLGEEETLDLFLPLDTEETRKGNCTYSTTSGHTMYTSTGEGAFVSFKTTVKEDGELFFHAPSDYTRLCNLFVNGVKKGEYFGNDTTRIISLGDFDAGDEVTVRLELQANELYLKNGEKFFYYLDTEVFEDAFARLKAGPQFEIEEGYTDSHLWGSITTTEPQTTILATIPYDEGWKITLDGEEIEYYKTLDALIAFEIEDAGEHTLEFKYSPKIYTVGAIISISGVILFVIICLLDIFAKKPLRRLLKLEEKEYEESYWTLEDFDDDAAEEALLSPEEKREKTFKETFEDIKKLFAKKENSAKKAPPEILEKPADKSEEKAIDAQDDANKKDEENN